MTVRRRACLCRRARRLGRAHALAALAVTAGSLLASACASAQQAEPESRVGCYQIQRDAAARALGLPWGFVLEEAPLESGWPVLTSRPDARLALTATSATGREDHPFGYWARTPGDSIEIGYPGGGAGFLLRLAPTGQDLSGPGRAVGDAVQPGEPVGARPTAVVTARRVLCGAS